MAIIVLVEDDKLLSEMYQTKLELAGHTCVPAYDGASGLLLVQSSMPDLVLLDLMLPQMSGDQVLLSMRQNDTTKDTKVILMTNINESEAPEILQTLHFESYIVKADHTLENVLLIVEETLQTAAN